jgi:gamma-glutamylcyclotransferase (GGCT)/AIG2-like uncharacterized protein YtfP
VSDDVLEEVAPLVAAANAARGWIDAAVRAHGAGAMDGAVAERTLEGRFATHRTLAVYGTLAPGRSNHHVVAPLGGAWTDGEVEGELWPDGWGAIVGYPAFRPRPGGGAVAVQVLVSAALPGAWRALDAFEGAEYRRILVPVLRTDARGARRLHTVANLYAADAPGSRAASR